MSHVVSYWLAGPGDEVEHPVSFVEYNEVLNREWPDHPTYLSGWEAHGWSGHRRIEVRGVMPPVEPKR